MCVCACVRVCVCAYVCMCVRTGVSAVCIHPDFCPFFLTRTRALSHSRTNSLPLSRVCLPTLPNPHFTLPLTDSISLYHACTCARTLYIALSLARSLSRVGSKLLKTNSSAPTSSQNQQNKFSLHSTAPHTVARVRRAATDVTSARRQRWRRSER